MKLQVLSCAEQEFVEAVDYYNEQFPGLGYEFAAEVKNTFDRISSFPEAWPGISSRSRRCITNKFPSAVDRSHPACVLQKVLPGIFQ